MGTLQTIEIAIFISQLCWLLLILHVHAHLFSRGPLALNLPSYLYHKRAAASTRAKRPWIVNLGTRTSLAYLGRYLGNRGAVKYPRGKYRARLGTREKIHIVEDMTVEQVATEVRSVFKGPMNNRNDFPFQYLQWTGSGSRTLSVPSVSSSFNWTAKQVARLGGTTGTLHFGWWWPSQRGRKYTYMLAVTKGRAMNLSC